MARNINKSVSGNNILLSPLDWGMGHASRCVPIVQELLNQNANVIIASSEATESLLKKEFPTLTFLGLPGYEIQYSANKKFFMVKILSQLPKLYKKIRLENRWVNNIVQELKIDGIVSDNRLGFRHKNIPSVIISHQLQILTGNAFLNTIARWSNYFFLKKFNQCWVPDLPGKVNLAGKLSHPYKKPGLPTRYLGTLSRFKKPEATAISVDLLVVLSGPEPMRTILEEKIIKELGQYKGKFIIVRGLPGETDIISVPANVQVHNHCSAIEMQKLMEASEKIICRSGYSSVMDLVRLKKKACLIPTPGQTEQEYLAEHLSASGIFPFLTEETFTLQKALEKMERFPYKNIIEENYLSETVSKFLSLI